MRLKTTMNQSKPVENQVYSDDIYMELENEFEHVRTCLGMYISKDETEGAMHLVKEIINNAIDESVNPNSIKSPSKKVYITFNEDNCEFTVTDEGRGIPFSELKGVSMKKHTSTKFVRSEPWMKGQAGRNGVGLVVTAALSDYMALTSYRGKKVQTVAFTDGKLEESPITNLKKLQNGLSVKFVPSEKYLGEINLGIDLVEDYLRPLSYLLPENLKIVFYGEPSGEDNKLIKRDYKYQGLSSNVEYMSTTLEYPPIDIEYISDDFDLLLSFSYDKTLDGMAVDSYCNYIHTTEGGTHEIAAQRAVCDFFSREARKLDPKNKFEVTYEDCKKGLIMAINCRHIDPGFEGQHKSKVNNKDVQQDGKRGLNSALYKYFNNNNALLRRIVAYLRQISRIRQESNKIKGVSLKRPSTFLDDSELKLTFSNISNRNYSGYTELIITEGDSAYGAIMNARNHINQAVCAAIGVPDNTHGLNIVQLLSKPIFRDLATILGCGIVGKDFDITKLKYKKIILLTDSDVDGDNITSLFLLFIFLFMRPLIDEGYVYKAMPPLYLIDSKPIRKYYKGNPWLFDKSDYYELANEIISKNVEVAIDNDNGGQDILKRKELRRWLELNGDYLLELDSLVTRTAGDPLILEYVCKYLMEARGNPEKFKSLIEKQFSELEYDIYESNLSGSFHGEYKSLITDEIFMKIASRFLNLMNENPSFYIYSKNKNEPNDKFEKQTIGEFLTQMDKSFNIKIDRRFKGLGEAEPDILFTTTLNPKVRRLLRMNINDIEEAVKSFDLLHGKSAEMRVMRSELLSNAHISYSDIDN